MGNRSSVRRRWAAGGIGAALVATVGIGLVVAPAGASAAPELPPVSPEDLVSSVLTAEPGPFNGTVSLDNQLGLPALPGAPQAANGTSTARIWSGDDGKGRVSLPTDQGEKTFVSDGATRWSYDSETRTVTKVPAKQGGGPGEKQGGRPDRAPEAGTTGPPEVAAPDPAAAAATAIGELRNTSTVSVDGTAEVAGRPAYQLVLDPKPTERTLLREVRIAVDAEKRIPLQLSVLANGSPEPALQVGFTDVTFGPQDASLFAFTPPPGSTVRDEPATTDRAKPGPAGPKPGQDAGRDAARPTIVGDGWDTVVVARTPAQAKPGEPKPDSAEQGDQGAPEGAGAPDLSALGTPVSGPWGAGRQISTAVGTAIIADDGRIAAGAVPAQVLTEALAR
ncbi:outer membrane lipoprotein carrier protein LolA [Pseudonocardia sp. KRD291]|uniref:LolA family protein n=1 Tax=Pseudonocardia sp. KRD291 TaxID=2792007 RepID=UPI001C4A21B8|nr:outer membrane lipoprotein carrier protein LolA [Pseudonocardia sp. KRD291]MBW0105856.1 outer membrane lipoprotein carrier protein LolA [Pseudonocardia sp. KRD291]